MQVQQFTATGVLGSDTVNLLNALFASVYPAQPQPLVAASGAINPNTSGLYLITDAGVAALTLAAPTQNGIVITLVSTTAEAHTLTATGLLATGTASVNEATFAAHQGAGLTLYSYNGLWYFLSSVGISLS